MTPLTLTSTSTRFRSTFRKRLKTAEKSQFWKSSDTVQLLRGAGGARSEVREKVMEQQLRAVSGTAPRHNGAEMSGVTFSITELADEFGLTTRAIRFYEDKGLLTPERRGQTRIYHPRDRARLTLIVRGKNVG